MMMNGIMAEYLKDAASGEQARHGFVVHVSL